MHKILILFFILAISGCASGEIQETVKDNNKDDSKLHYVRTFYHSDDVEIEIKANKWKRAYKNKQDSDPKKDILYHQSEAMRGYFIGNYQFNRNWSPYDEIKPDVFAQCQKIVKKCNCEQEVYFKRDLEFDSSRIRDENHVRYDYEREEYWRNVCLYQCYNDVYNQDIKPFEPCFGLTVEQGIQAYCNLEKGIRNKTRFPGRYNLQVINRVFKDSPCKGLK